MRNERISMCGYGAAVAMLVAMREMGAAYGELLRYATSGEVNGDMQGSGWLRGNRDYVKWLGFTDCKKFKTLSFRGMFFAEEFLILLTLESGEIPHGVYPGSCRASE